jgi:zinc transporter ZupT
MEYMTLEYLLWAVALGGISAVSLPLGSMVGISFSFRPFVISIMAAFGAGALIAALSVELVAPTVMALTESGHGSGHAIQNFYSLIAGLVFGGILYVILDQLVNAKGGFLRKTAAIIGYLSIKEKEKSKKFIDTFSMFHILHNLTGENVNLLLKMVHPFLFNDEEIIAEQGAKLDKLLFIAQGEVEAKRNEVEAGIFGVGSIIGIVPLIMDSANPGSVKARGIVKGFYLSEADFKKFLLLSPKFMKQCEEYTSEQLSLIEKTDTVQTEKMQEWKSEAVKALEVGAQLPSSADLIRAKEEHHGAPLAIWMGILIDGIPESFVIGSGMLIVLKAKLVALGTVSFGDIIPFTLIVGLFLSNFPEALSSSATMSKQGWNKWKIFLMWFALLVVTAVGAGCGFLLAESLSHTWLVFAEGLAAGAMLTMIAAAMIPEAVHTGNANAVGLSTLFGFIAAIGFKLLE